jgi:uncharacterized protein involved in outer membrane biogenesis
MSRTPRNIFIGLALVVAVIGAVILLFQWNMLRPLVAHQVEAHTGRHFAINGDLHVHLGREPVITADDVVFGNASWSSRPEMARIDRLEFRLRLWPLIHAKVEIPEISLMRPWLLIEQGSEGHGNWEFDRPTQARSTKPSAWTVQLGRVDVRGGQLLVEVPDQKISLHADIDARQGATENDGRIAAHGTGNYRNLPFEVRSEGGAVFGLRDANNPYPLKVEGHIGDTRFTADGTMTDVRALHGMVIRFTLAGASLAELYPILRLPLPPTPAYQLSGMLEHEAQEWRFSRFAGKVGTSDVAGDWAVDIGRKPRQITANLTSKQLDLADLSGVIGARTETGKPVQPKGDKVLPQNPINLDKLRVANADVHFRGERIINGKLPLDDLDVRLRLEDGKLTLDPLAVGVADGRVRVHLDMDTTRHPTHTNAYISATRLRLTRLLPSLGENKRVNTGLVGGRASLAMDGNSVARMLGSADGNAAFIMSGGEISKLLLRLANLDIANLVPIVLAGDKPVPVNCMVAELKSNDGKAKVDSFVLDTKKQLVKGSGDADFSAEKLDLKLDVHPKDISLVSLRGPIDIRGTFKKPAVRPEVAEPSLRTAAAIALGFVTPPLALLPLVEIGTADDAPCAQLIRRASR